MTRFPDVDIRQPQPFDMVGTPINVAGMINIADEPGTVVVLDADGNELATSGTVSATTFGARDFGVSLDVSSFPTQTGTIVVRMFGGASAEVPVTFGPGLVASYDGYGVHVVESGETLSGIAADIYQDENAWPLIAVANRDIVSDPNLIFPGQELRFAVDTSKGV